MTPPRTLVAPAAALAVSFAMGCSASEPNGRPASAHAASGDATVGRDIDAKATTMTTSTCEDARRAIEARRFIGWRGLPEACSPADLFGIPTDEHWGTRRLGKVSARQRLLDVTGYHRPLLSVREDVVVLFDGAYPELDGGWDALRADLGDPEAKLDYRDGTITIAASEWVYPARGIAVFVSSDASRVYHVAVFAPTTLDAYQERLRPNYAETRLPRR